MLFASYADTQARSDSLGVSLASVIADEPELFLALGPGVDAPEIPGWDVVPFHVPMTQPNPHHCENAGFIAASGWASRQMDRFFMWLDNPDVPAGEWPTLLLREARYTESLNPVLSASILTKAVEMTGARYDVRVPGNLDLLVPCDFHDRIKGFGSSIPGSARWNDAFVWILNPLVEPSGTLAEAYGLATTVKPSRRKASR